MPSWSALIRTVNGLLSIRVSDTSQPAARITDESRSVVKASDESNQ